MLLGVVFWLVLMWWGDVYIWVLWLELVLGVLLVCILGGTSILLVPELLLWGLC